MDRVRFGRALGKGARAAVRTAMEAAAAASAPSAEPRSAAPRTAVEEHRAMGTRRPPVVLPPAAVQNLRPAAQKAAARVAGPLRRASKALWYELTGSFFGLFALSFVLGVWHTRANATSAMAAGRYRFAAFCVLALLFGYFSVSSFLRARKVSQA